MTIPIGTEVQVHLAKSTEIPNDPREKFNGENFVVKRRKTVIKSKTSYFTYYELYGAKSKYGIPYCFSEEDLIVL